ncbi:MAG: hypothetical protein AAF756_10330 [Pseudomonadota bacterium]
MHENQVSQRRSKPGLVSLLLLLIISTACLLAVQDRWLWSTDDWALKLGDQSVNDHALSIVLNDDGVALIELPFEDARARAMSRFRVRTSNSMALEDVGLVWWRANGADLSSIKLAALDEAPGDFSASLADASDWPSPLPVLMLRFRGEAGSQFTLDSIEMDNPGVLERLLAELSGRFALEPWQISSINHFQPPVATIQGWNLTLIANLFVVLIGGVAALAPRSSLRLSWVVLLSAFLICWVFTDAAWLRQLSGRALESASRFSNLSARERLERSIDGAVVRRVADVRPFFEPGARVFVATSDEWMGNRTAYYLYPNNVYWVRGAAEFPGPESLRSGDKLLLLPPSSHQLIGTEPLELRWSDGGAAKVKMLLQRPWGVLLEFAR